MAIVIRGKTCCRLCGRVHAPDDELELFPSGLFAPGEPEFEVNDAGVHRDCLLAQPYGAEALRRLEEYLARWS